MNKRQNGTILPIDSNFDAKFVEKAYKQGLDFLDNTYHTPLRVFGVVTDIIANGSSASNDNPLSRYNQFIHGDSRSGYSQRELTFGAASIAFFTLGIFVARYQLVHERSMNSFERLVAIRGEATGRGEDVDIIETARVIEDLIKDGKVPYTPYQPASRATIKATKPTERYTLKTVKDFFNETTYGYAAAKAWEWSLDAAGFFWPVWFIGALVTSLAAASTTTLPAIALTTVVAFLTTKYAIGRYKAYRTENNYDHDDDASQHELNEIKSMRKTAIARVAVKSAHEGFRAQLEELRPGTQQGIFKSFKKAKANRPDPTNPHHNVRVDVHGQINFTLLPHQPANGTTPSSSNVAPANSPLAQRLLGSEGEFKKRQAISTLLTTLGYYTATFFIIWLLGSLALGLSGIAVLFPAMYVNSIAATIVGPWLATAGTLLAGLGNALGSATFGFAVSALSGLLFGAYQYVDLNDKRQQEHDAVIEKLSRSVTYKDINGNDVTSNLNDKYADYLKNMDTLKEEVEALQNRIRQARIHQGPALTKEQAFILQYDMSKVDVNNDRYFEQQEHRASWFARLKESTPRTYQAISSFLSFVFIGRSLFLAGAVFASVPLWFGTGVLPILGILAFMGSLGSLVRSYKMHYDEQHDHRLHALSDIEVRISWMKKQIKEMQDLQTLSNKMTTSVASSSDNSSPAPATAAPRKNGEVHTSKNGLFSHPSLNGCTDEKSIEMRKLMQSLN